MNLINPRSEDINASCRVTSTSTPVIVKAKNVSSITDRAAGRFTIVFASALPSANYAESVNGTDARYGFEDDAITQLATALPIAFYTASAAYGDPDLFTVIVTGA
jgi:hypothetical protein